MSKPTRISVLLQVLEPAEGLSLTLAALAHQHLPELDFELIALYAGDQPQILEQLSTHPLASKLILKRFAPGTNWLTMLSQLELQTDWVLCTSSRMLPMRDWVYQHLEALQKLPDRWNMLSGRSEFTPEWPGSLLSEALRQLGLSLPAWGEDLFQRPRFLAFNLENCSFPTEALQHLRASQLPLSPGPLQNWGFGFLAWQQGYRLVYQADAVAICRQQPDLAQLERLLQLITSECPLLISSLPEILGPLLQISCLDLPALQAEYQRNQPLLEQQSQIWAQAGQDFIPLSQSERRKPAFQALLYALQLNLRQRLLGSLLQALETDARLAEQLQTFWGRENQLLNLSYQRPQTPDKLTAELQSQTPPQFWSAAYQSFLHAKADLLYLLERFLPAGACLEWTATDWLASQVLASRQRYLVHDQQWGASLPQELQEGIRLTYWRQAFELDSELQGQLELVLLNLDRNTLAHLAAFEHWLDPWLRPGGILMLSGPRPELLQECFQLIRQNYAYLPLSGYCSEQICLLQKFTGPGSSTGRSLGLSA